MSTETKVIRSRKWRRWVPIGPCDIRLLCQIARGHGKKIVVAIKWDMHFYNWIGLHGTSAQMKATESAWLAEGHKEVLSRRPGAWNDFSIDRPKESWPEFTVDWTAPGTRWKD
jgi:hypothetical protein